MNKKGFTLTELMAVLIILAVVTIISVSSVLSARDKANKRLDDNTKILIESAAKRYASENEVSGNCIDVQVLVDEDYLKEPIINDEKKNKELLENSVTIDGNKNYKLSSGKCA